MKSVTESIKHCRVSTSGYTVTYKLKHMPTSDRSIMVHADIESRGSVLPSFQYGEASVVEFKNTSTDEVEASISYDGNRAITLKDQGKYVYGDYIEYYTDEEYDDPVIKTINERLGEDALISNLGLSYDYAFPMVYIMKDEFPSTISFDVEIHDGSSIETQVVDLPVPGTVTKDWGTIETRFTYVYPDEETELHILQVRFTGSSSYFSGGKNVRIKWATYEAEELSNHTEVVTTSESETTYELKYAKDESECFYVKLADDDVLYLFTHAVARAIEIGSVTLTYDGDRTFSYSNSDPDVESYMFSISYEAELPTEIKLVGGRTDLWQWDTGQSMIIPEGVTEVHYGTPKMEKFLVVSVDGTHRVPIADFVLERPATELIVYEYVRNGSEAHTIWKKSIRMHPRHQPNTVN